MIESMTQVTPSTNCRAFSASSLLKRGLRAAADCIRPDNRRPAHNDRRAEPRLKVVFDVSISGEFGSRGARGLDLHNSGALILAAQPLAPESMVFVHVKSFGLMGFAKVRHCTARGVNRYAIGVEFPKPLMRDAIGTWEFHHIRQTDTG
jgi:hypothetical protein